MSNETIVALFGTRADADRARSALESAGVSATSIDIRAEAGTDLADTNPTTEHRGFWDWLFGDNGPDERHAYRDRLSSGNVLLSVQPGAVDSSAVHDILYRYDPLDIDEETSVLGREADGTTIGETDSVASLEGNSALLGKASERGQLAASGMGGTGAESDQPSSGHMNAFDDARVVESAQRTAGEEGVIPIVQEDLVVGKRMVDQGTVRVRSYVMEQPVERKVDLRQETISVERRQPVTGLDAPTGAIEERVIEVTQRSEEPVVEKRARVTEEVVVNRKDSSRTETVHDTVRGTEVEVERDGVLESRDR